jgi:hypothetical protein
MIEEAGGDVDRLTLFGDRVAAQVVAATVYGGASFILVSLYGFLKFRGWQRRRRQRHRPHTRRPKRRAVNIVNLTGNRIEIHHHHYYNDPPNQSNINDSD